MLVRYKTHRIRTRTQYLIFFSLHFVKIRLHHNDDDDDDCHYHHHQHHLPLHREELKLLFIFIKDNLFYRGRSQFAIDMIDYI